jgi:hypothetical protein
MDKRKLLVKKCTKNILQLLCEQLLEILHCEQNEKKNEYGYEVGWIEGILMEYQIYFSKN